MSGFKIKQGVDIWNNKRGIILIPVNCVGIMGCGLAKACKEKYPEIFKDYQRMCRNGKFILGTIKLYVIKDGFAIMLVPTKYHWRNPSKLEWVEYVLKKLGTCMSRAPMDTFHVPPLGCGAGGLDIGLIRPMVKKYLSHENVTINFYQLT